ncbi:MFS transporter [Nocardioides insulae]|uniref:MFS transporter n=1 Tax=Nocardioides insulae TaxID=394734 RepID=UPI00042087A3|nr:MFS transporter [Nocardioides insulae]
MLRASSTGRGPAHPGLIFLVTALGAFTATLNLSLGNVAFPDLAASFPQASAADLSWVLTSYNIVFGALLIIGGRTADTWGRKRTFMAGLGIFLLGALLCGLAPSLPVLVAARVVQGAGAAFLMPSSLALLIDAFPPERRTHMVALWGGVGALAVAIGPSIGAVVVELGGWPWAFFINIPVGLVVAVLGARVLVEAVPTELRPRPDYLGAVLVTFAMGALVLAVAQGAEWGWDDPRVLAAFAAAVVAAYWFLRRSVRHPEPVVDLAMFKDRTFALANLATFIYGTGFFAMQLGNILFLTGVWGWSIFAAGLAVTPGPVMVALVSGPAGKLAARIGFRALLIAGALVYATGMLWYYVGADLTPDYFWVWLPASVIGGLGVGLTLPILSAAAVAGLPPARYAVGSAVNQTARQIGGALGLAIMVVLLGDQSSLSSSLAGFDRIWLYAAATALLSGAVAVFVPRVQAPVGEVR